MTLSKLFIPVLAALTLYSCGSSQETAAKEEHSPNAKVEVIHLVQTPGEFTNGDLTLSPGVYHFEVQNDNAGKDVGLVVAPKKEEIAETDHIQNAYVQELVKDGQTVSCKGDVVLEKGEYVYFCPLNPTPQYTITVQ